MNDVMLKNLSEERITSEEAYRKATDKSRISQAEARA